MCEWVCHNFLCFLLVFSLQTMCIFYIFVLHLNLSAIKRLCILIFVCLQFIFSFHFCGKCRWVDLFSLSRLFAAVVVWFSCVKSPWMITGVVFCQLASLLLLISSHFKSNHRYCINMYSYLSSLVGYTSWTPKQNHHPLLQSAASSNDAFIGF